jgi:hypothetical protein
MATRTQIWQAAKDAVRDEVRRHRPNQRIWTTLTPEALGAGADSWEVWSGDMVDSFNAKAVKAAISISATKRRTYRRKQLIEFAEALRDA